MQKLKYFIAILGVTLAVKFTDAAERVWMPSLKQIKNMESVMVMPENAPQLTRYKRYYSGIVENSEKIIVGILVVDNHSATINIVNPRALPQVLDGGCDVVNIRYSVAKKKILTIFCNGEG